MIFKRNRNKQTEAAVEQAPAPAETAPEPTPQPLRERMRATRQQIAQSLKGMVNVRRRIDEDVLEELETALLVADVGAQTTGTILDELRLRIKRSRLDDFDALMGALKDYLTDMANKVAVPLTIQRPASGGPFVILVVGVNGAGKTTTIGKLAARYKAEGKSVLLAAGDSYRAAACEQLAEWGRRVDVPVISQGEGADSASVIFDTVAAAKARNIDVVIADTAGRLHTRGGLMDELTKVSRVVAKQDETAPHEVLLVLDGSTGQNALSQTREFAAAVKVSGLALTKLDGTAKGGVLFALANTFGIPMRYIGVGEQVHDLRDFDPAEFVDALLP
ncbi:MAG: hypothetical protein DHS20C11_01370 [Lysobacteraceae bacterium]|nr:MAG: hypothetical protein DHS20C11_01370 [Xanthomonadaceae bacterium]